MADISKETVQQFQVREQRAWQRRAVVILAELLEQGERGDLPVLTCDIYTDDEHEQAGPSGTRAGTA